MLTAKKFAAANAVAAVKTKKSNLGAPCIPCQMATATAKNTAMGLAQEALVSGAGSKAALQVAKRIPEYLTARTSRDIVLSTARNTVGAKILGSVFLALEFKDAAVGAVHTYNYAQQGKLPETAKAASKTTGAILTATASIAAGVTAAALVTASAPVWVPVAASVVAGAAIAVGAEWAWRKWGQKRTELAYKNYLTMPQADFDKFNANPAVKIASSIGSGVIAASKWTADKVQFWK